MSRKDFILIAATLESAKPCKSVEGYEGKYWAWQDVCQKFASALASTNNAFNRGRFLAACGVEEEGRGK